MAAPRRRHREAGAGAGAAELAVEATAAPYPRPHRAVLTRHRAPSEPSAGGAGPLARHAGDSDEPPRVNDNCTRLAGTAAQRSYQSRVPGGHTNRHPPPALHAHAVAYLSNDPRFHSLAHLVWAAQPAGHVMRGGGRVKQFFTVHGSVQQILPGSPFNLHPLQWHPAECLYAAAAYAFS